MKIGIILGTRPEIIKMSPIIRYCSMQGIGFFILHSGQHYSYNMDKVFFDELQLPEPSYNLETGSGDPGEQTARMIIGIEKVLLHENPDVILVQGDTNTVLAGAIAGVKTGTQIGHVEAGLRSFDRSMPEEINRILADHCSDYLFAPTKTAEQNLIHEGIPVGKIRVCGNTIVDAVYQNLQIAGKKRTVISSLHLHPGKYFVLTAHRQENVDDKQRILGIINGVREVYLQYGYPVIFPIHPRTRKQLELFRIPPPDGLLFTEPLGYLDFLLLEKESLLVLTDSGGLQEECCIMQVPCVTLRDNTERPETIEVGANILVGSDSRSIITGVRTMMNKARDWKNPFGDGKSGERIINSITSEA
ncbi:MAG: UDP-N-acetylglucosamine 2-epimerase (non-hydrolyzing) [Methanospirillum sp.]|uniref:non-hydrolyzing UDP-N-acetylglucosamine 2-epimerase n=1 Tax=Methanospirillum sp. TaxID=45200 RepID=UPI0023753E23|nr:UDP-N-acetylglucosamine 2-epimerase (non-hydrolyzing) [Methanospirillum sp.]MDD1730358.1 UDP-N-acetylglucosamine 2-epimerase (non-hydrolyzing) [Methanospirillum sp.]